MKAYAVKVWNNPLFFLFMNATLAYVALTVVIIGTLQIPPEAILDSGLQDILSVFEGDF